MTFASDLTSFQAKAKVKTEAAVREVVIILGKRIVQRSPVGDADYWISKPPPGYVGGRFKGNWQYGFNQRPEGDLPDIDASGNVSQKRIEGVLTHPVIGIHYITNNLPYAQRLEDGWSKRQCPPNGMIGLTATEFPSIVREVAKG